MKLFISEPEERHQGAILVHDEALNDIAEFYHNEHATVGQSYETALALAQKLVTPTEPQTSGETEQDLREQNLRGLLREARDYVEVADTDHSASLLSDINDTLSLTRPESK